MHTVALILSPVIVALYVLSIPAGWRICQWKFRYTAVLVTVIFPFVGLVMALLLDSKCRHGYGYLSMAASVCPHCGRNVADGAVPVRPAK